MERFDAIVVGGGPAGSTCAWQLRRAGLDVAVVDKRDFPRDKVCAGWVTPAAVETLRLDLDEYRSGRVCQPIRSFRTGSVAGTDGGDPLRRGGELRHPPRRVRPLPPRPERREAAYRARRQAPQARERAVADQRRCGSAGRRGGGRALLPRRPSPGGQGGLDRGHRRRPRGRVRDDRRPAGRLRGGGGDSGDLLLRGPQGLRLGVPQGERSQRRARTRGEPQHRGPRQGVLRVARREGPDPARHALEVQGACLHPARALAADLLRGRNCPRGRRDRARLRPERRGHSPRRRVRGHRGRAHRGRRAARSTRPRSRTTSAASGSASASGGRRPILRPGSRPEHGGRSRRSSSARVGSRAASSSTAGSSTAASPRFPRAERVQAGPEER